MTITAFNLATDEAITFLASDAATPIHAVAYAYAEQNNMLSRFFELARRDATMDEYRQAAFPVIEGKRSIACGDWSALHAGA